MSTAARDAVSLGALTAAWLVGSIRYLGSAGARWLTYFVTTGWRGMLDDPAAGNQRFPMSAGAVYPVYHVFADVGEFAGSEVLEVSTSDPLAVEALALRSGSRIRILVANLAGEQERIRLSLPRIERASLRVLDETTAEQAMMRPDDFRQRVDREFDPCPEHVELDLAPYAVARLDGTLA